MISVEQIRSVAAGPSSCPRILGDRKRQRCRLCRVHDQSCGLQHDRGGRRLRRERGRAAGSRLGRRNQLCREVDRSCLCRW